MFDHHRAEITVMQFTGHPVHQFVTAPCPILSAKLYFTNILSVSVVKFQFLAQFQVDYLSNPVMPTLVLILYLFAAFTYNVINCFFFVTT